MFLEIKRENVKIYHRDGNLVTEEQVRIEAAFLARMNALGYFARFGIGMEGCERLLRGYLNPEYRREENGELFQASSSSPYLSLSGAVPFATLYV